MRAGTISHHKFGNSNCTLIAHFNRELRKYYNETKVGHCHQNEPCASRAVHHDNLYLQQAKVMQHLFHFYELILEYKIGTSTANFDFIL